MVVAAARQPPDPRRRWNIVFTAEAAQWYRSLSQEGRAGLAAALDHLHEHGPAARRPLVGTISGSRLHNMKELRSSGGNLRALFAFDRRREAVVLVGGDKTGKWKSWYDKAIPKAERLYDQHLRRIGKEATWSPRHRSPGRSSGGRSR
jgi:hypothetical protein